jgi:hypothetical protein
MRDEELPIIRDFYEFVVWFVPKIGKFPRDQRFTLGERMELALFQVLELLLKAKYAREKRDLLEQVNLQLEIVRFQLRLAKDLGGLPLKAYGDSSERLIAVGKQVGGWLKSEAGKRKDSPPTKAVP